MMAVEASLSSEGQRFLQRSRCVDSISAQYSRIFQPLFQATGGGGWNDLKQANL